MFDVSKSWIEPRNCATSPSVPGFQKLDLLFRYLDPTRLAVLSNRGTLKERTATDLRHCHPTCNALHRAGRVCGTLRVHSESKMRTMEKKNEKSKSQKAKTSNCQNFEESENAKNHTNKKSEKLQQNSKSQKVQKPQFFKFQDTS